ncbi:hypothetical protein SAMN06269185_2978 [Natronoarchaeum philippinense]|uniref:RCK C-terminal domain-containing protein n=1 Tax=Natronoarchaeum philippinense TaxID=558529 RepID=A0A285PAY9_NATPI|nr:potassium transporter TrkA [Natronoarchaeum philippinense]SNZ17306.1 hypothetical protein SAMN06269185_2978 [Natronoarchaeum philippinense]
MVAPMIEAALTAAVRIAGLAALSGGVAFLAALAYRWYGRTAIPDGPAVLLGLSSVALWLNTTATLIGAIGGNDALVEPTTALYTVGAFVVAGIAADAGKRAGDRVALDTATFSAGVSGSLDADVSALVRARGRTIRVTLPDEIDDVEGYDPVAPDRKDDIAGTTLHFPRGLTVGDLRERIAARLEDDYGVGYVDVEVSADGEVEHLALGRRQAGLGRTLPPGTVGVALRADPAFSASPGDAVEVWSAGADAERVTTAELRAAVDDIVTLVVDERDADALDAAEHYRLVTLPREPRADRELLAGIREADEVAGVVDVAAGDDLDGTTVGGLAATVVAIDGPNGLEGTPRPGRALASGDRVYALGRPENLRRIGARPSEIASD